LAGFNFDELLPHVERFAQNHGLPNMRPLT
jgi:hypothetical protein